MIDGATYYPCQQREVGVRSTVGEEEEDVAIVEDRSEVLGFVRAHKAPFECPAERS